MGWFVCKWWWRRKPRDLVSDTEEKGTQGRGAVSFPERLCLIVKETERDSHSYESRVSAKAVSELEEFRP